VRRHLGLRRELDTSETFGEAWAAWLSGRRKARDSYANTLGQHGRNWLLPVLKDIPLDRLTGEHCAMVFERIDMFNEEIEAAREEKRRPVLPGDVRGQKKYTGVATQHRIYGVLRMFLNHQWEKAHKIPFNPVYAVELETETRAAPLVWDPAQVAHFLDFTADDRLALLWRFLLLRGFRRGELCGMADADVDTGRAAVTVNVALIQINGKPVWGRPKSKAGERVVGLDQTSVAMVNAHAGGASASAWPRARRGPTPGRCLPTNSARPCIPNTSRAGSARWPGKRDCPSSSSTRDGTRRPRSHSRRASTSRSWPSSWGTPRPGSHRISTSTSGTRYTLTRPRKSSSCCPAARGRRKQDHDRLRPFCLRRACQ
jgi:integrase